MAAAGMLILGLAGGLMTYQQQKENAKIAKYNAEQAVLGQEYERKVRDTNLILSEGQRQQTQASQNLVNNATLGTIQSKMGVSGSTGGSVLEKMADVARMGGIESSKIDFSFGKQWAKATAAGNMAIYNLERQEQAYLNQASQANRAATIGLLSGAATGIGGVYSVGGTMSNLFGATTATTAQTLASLGLAGTTALTSATSGSTAQNFSFTPSDDMFNLDFDFGGLNQIRYGHGLGGSF